MRLQRPAVGAVCLLTLVTDTGYSLLHYLSYHAPAYDLGFFDNVAEHPWDTTFLHYPFLGQHWEPLLLIATALDHLAPTPVWLLLMQGIALSLAPLGAALLARSWLPACRGAPLIAAVVVATNPLVGRAAAADFHMESFTPALTLFALAAAARGRTFWLIVCCALLLLIKEDAVLVVIGIGLIVWRVEHRPRLGAGLMVTASLLFAVLVLAVMPAIRAGHASDLAARYAYLGGGTPGAMLAGAAAHPGRLVGRLMSPPALRGAAVALLPGGLLPLLGGAGLVACVLPLAVALLSADSGQASLQYHYGLEVAPLLIAAALLGWRRVHAGAAVAGLWWARQVLGRGLAAVALVAYLAVSPLPGGRTFDATQVSGLGRRADVEALLRRVPAGESVSASTGLVAHLSARRAAVFEFNGGIGVPWVVIDTRILPSDQSRAAGYDGSLARLPALGYREVGEAGGVILWHRR